MVKIVRKKPVYQANPAYALEAEKERAEAKAKVKARKEEKRIDVLERENQRLRDYIINDILEEQIAREKK